MTSFSVIRGSTHKYCTCILRKSILRYYQEERIHVITHYRDIFRTFVLVCLMLTYLVWNDLLRSMDLATPNLFFIIGLYLQYLNHCIFWRFTNLISFLPLIMTAVWLKPLGICFKIYHLYIGFNALTPFSCFYTCSRNKTMNHSCIHVFSLNFKVNLRDSTYRFPIYFKACYL